MTHYMKSGSHPCIFIKKLSNLTAGFMKSNFIFLMRLAELLREIILLNPCLPLGLMTDFKKILLAIELRSIS